MRRATQLLRRMLPLLLVPASISTALLLTNERSLSAGSMKIVETCNEQKRSCEMPRSAALCEALDPHVISQTTTLPTGWYPGMASAPVSCRSSEMLGEPVSPSARLRLASPTTLEETTTTTIEPTTTTLAVPGTDYTIDTPCIDPGPSTVGEWASCRTAHDVQGMRDSLTWAGWFGVCALWALVIIGFGKSRS